MKWEAKISTLQRDHKETMFEKMKIGCIFMVFPKSLSEKVVEQFGRFKTYREVHDKVVSLVQSFYKYSLRDEMDCSLLDSPASRGGSVHDDDISLDAVSRDHCARCAGFGHYASTCPTPPHMGLGKGGRPGASPGKGGSTLKRTHCHKDGHTKDRCFVLCPEQKGKAKSRGKGGRGGKARRLNGVDEHHKEEGQDEQWIGWIEVCALDEVPTPAKVPSTTDKTGGWTLQSYSKYRTANTA